MAAVLVVGALAFVGVRLERLGARGGGDPDHPAHPGGRLRPRSSLPWTKNGQSAIAVPSVGIDVQSGPEQAVPIASLTKMMTAYIILRDHPLTVGQNGPSITITQADLNDYDTTR